MKQSHNILVSFGINDSLRKWAVQASGQPFVYFNYNPVGDNTKVYSAVANDWERNYTYDLLGRRLTYTEGELAESYTYNGGNLASHSQSWTENNQQQTKTTTYHYNAHRLDSVSYEDALTTIYHYDQYGRVDSLYDESGVMCYEYGNMGEITKETRIYALPFLSQPIALTTQFRYDSWGRVDSIFYPDGERLNYRYDLGGQLQSVSNNSSYTYLDNVSYDRFGAKLHQEYGNGLVTDYDYDNTTRRLSQITVTDNSNNPYSDIQYTYDPVGNVTQVASSYSWTQGQAFTEAFAYDASDQLVSAAETQAQCYQLEVGYGDWGRIDDYSLLHTELWSGATTHDHRSFAYPNDPYNPQQAQTLFAPETHNGTSDVTYTFGINGSLRKREVHSPNPCTEYYLFNSAANLKAYSYDGLDFAYYGYNAANTRTYKLSMLNMNQWVNGQPQPIQLQMQQAMFYPNAYLNFNQNGEYTKHYYNGSERIASRLGDMTAYIYAEAGERLENRIMRLDALFRSQIGELVSYEEPEQPAILGNRNGGTRDLVSPPVEYEPFLSIPSLQPTGTPDDIFYYHTNHLGSTAYVTDQNQNITQGFLYAPFGEITTEYNPTFYSNVLPKYSFNAKELDEETGMYYYEARYYKPPVFTSRDPMFEKYFWMTPYAYCANNPVKYVDPSGEEYGDYYDSYGNWLFSDGCDDGCVYEQVPFGEVAYGIGVLKQPFFTFVGCIDEVKLTFTGSTASNSKKAVGQLNIIQMVGDKEYTRASFDAVSGSKNLYPLPNGDYVTDDLKSRTKTAMVKDGIGFSIRLTPSFLTGRTNLRIHPDGNVPGTEGCIGLTGSSKELKSFLNIIKTHYDNGGQINLNVNIDGNSNYQGPNF